MFLSIFIIFIFTQVNQHMSISFNGIGWKQEVYIESLRRKERFSQRSVFLQNINLKIYINLSKVTVILHIWNSYHIYHIYKISIKLLWLKDQGTDKRTKGRNWYAIRRQEEDRQIERTIIHCNIIINQNIMSNNIKGIETKLDLIASQKLKIFSYWKCY